MAPLSALQHERRVQQWIKDAQPSVIAAFLNAAIAGDGWAQQRKAHHRPSRAYVTTSRLPADGMQELFIKIGNAATMRVVQPKHRPVISGHQPPAIPKLQYHVYERLSSRAYLDGGGHGKRGYIGQTVHYEGRKSSAHGYQRPCRPHTACCGAACHQYGRRRHIFPN